MTETTRRGFLGMLTALVASCRLQPALAAVAPRAPLAPVRDVPAQLSVWEDAKHFPTHCVRVWLDGEEQRWAVAYDLDARWVDVWVGVHLGYDTTIRKYGDVVVRWADDPGAQQSRAEYLAGHWPTVAELQAAR